MELVLKVDHIAIDDGRVLTMRHDGQMGRGEDALQSLITVNEHIARARAHEELDAGDAVLVELTEQVGIVICGSKEERIVHVTLFSRQTVLVFQCLQRSGLRYGVGHIEIGGDTTCGCSYALRIDVGLFRHARLTEVHVVINNAWQHIAARGINRICTVCFMGGSMQLAIWHDSLDGIPINNNIANESPSFVDDSTTFNNRFHSFPLRMFWTTESEGSPTGA